MGRASALIVLLALGCGDNTSPGAAPGLRSDAAAAPDADLVDYQFTGIYLDWDSTTAAPCPIVGATWTTHYDASRIATTDANGAFTIPLASYLAELDIAPPAVASSCTAPPSPYQLPAAAIVPPAVFYAGGHFVARALTAARVSTFYAAVGSAFDAARAQLLVHIDGPARAVSITSPHAAEQAFDGTRWAAGSTGGDVYFPNIDVTGSMMTTVTVAGGAIGTGSLALHSGAIMYMTVIAH
jgi:hypothetical protein